MAKTQDHLSVLIIWHKNSVSSSVCTAIVINSDSTVLNEQVEDHLRDLHEQSCHLYIQVTFHFHD